MPPSEDHEITLELFRNRPELARKVAAEVFGLDMPDDLCWRMGPETVTNLAPQQITMDIALIGSSANSPRRAIIHEVQRKAGRADLERISYSWPEYVTSIRRRFQCPTTLIAMCPTPSIARRVGTPMKTGHPGFDLTVLAYSPHDLKPIVDTAEAQEWPEWVLLSSPAHADAEGTPVLEAVAAALQVTDEEYQGKYYDYVLARLTDAARHTLETIMMSDTYRPQSDWGRRLWSEGEAHGKAEGKAKGEAKALLAVLRSRGIEVSPEAADRITACADLDVLDVWLDKVALVERVEELFEGPTAG
ncbi:hypothetical protein [Actinomadura oligospora]|uniref:hypothetical protein n=1 Tax=Actinomadura oligospora TaxID=111804 RepID=UPI00047BD376|nr:hypothetical protein [Actinomadura oligospora]